MQLPFSSTSAPISLYYNIPFSKDIGLASVLQQPFRTGSKHPKKWVALYTGLGTKNGNVTKKIFCRVLNRPSESRGSQPSGLLLVLFVEAKRIKPFPFSETFEVLQTSIQRTQVAVSGKPHHGISRGVEAPPLPVHAKRVCRLLRKHSQADKPPFRRSRTGTFPCF